MRCIQIVVLLILFGAIRAEAQADLSQFFPNVPNCIKNIQPLTRDGNRLEQTAIYRIPRIAEQTQTSVSQPGEVDLTVYPDSFMPGLPTSCGSITIRSAPGLRHAARKQHKNAAQFDFSQSNKPFLIQGHLAYSASPLCGNDPWVGSTSIYFEKNMELQVSADQGPGEMLLDFTRSADYIAIKASIRRLLRI